MKTSACIFFALLCLGLVAAPATIFTVTTANDSGAGSLRSAMASANTNSDLDTIVFAIGTGIQTIRPQSPLPALIYPTIIDGTTQPGIPANVPGIELDGTDLQIGHGLEISGGNSFVKGMIVNRFKASGIALLTRGSNQIVRSYIGLNQSGTAKLGNTGQGVVIVDSTNNVITECVIGGNFDGIGIMNAPSSNNIVQKCLIGTDATGTLRLGNDGSGILITAEVIRSDYSGHNLIGGPPGLGNVISGNGWNGVRVFGGGNNRIVGNLIGLNKSGDDPIANELSGVLILSSTNNIVGGLNAADRNIISGNVGDGVEIRFASVAANENLVLGNRIGTDIDGLRAIPNSGNGVVIRTDATPDALASRNVIGNNLISGNGKYGVGITGSGSFLNSVTNNIIGLNKDESAALGNGSASGELAGGIGIGPSSETTNGGQFTLIENNTIAGNNGRGVALWSATWNSLRGNAIGLSQDLVTAFGNSKGGIGLKACTNNTIGGLSAGSRNVIAGFNLGHGIELWGGSSSNEVWGNWIGYAPATGVYGNSSSGVVIENSSFNLIGGTQVAARNIISENVDNGVFILSSTAHSHDTSGNVVQGNYIGTDHNGTGFWSNDRFGVVIQNSVSNLIGGDVTGARNVISGNGEEPGYAGVGLLDAAAFNRIEGNYIGTTENGQLPLPNSGPGVRIQNSFSNTVGGVLGQVFGTRNVISGNASYGVLILRGSELANGSGNKVQSNLIGTKADGVGQCGNGNYGVWVQNASGNVIGGVNAGNTIAFNGPLAPSTWLAGGIYVTSATNIVIRQNSIYANNGLGINLAAPLGYVSSDWDYFTLNDVVRDALGWPIYDTDDGPNHLQNFPYVASVAFDPSAGTKTIHWTLNSTPNTQFIIEFFRNETANLSGFGEGRYFMQDRVVLTDSAGTVSFTETFPMAYDFISATATDPYGNTSEFSMVDTDGDALADAWEMQGGIDRDGDTKLDWVFPTGAGAPPYNRNHKDLIVEVDAMRNRIPSAFYTPPLTTALDAVRNAFAAAPKELVQNPNNTDGINLHLIKTEFNLNDQPWPSATTNEQWDAFNLLKLGGAGGSSHGAFGDPLERQRLDWPKIKAARELVVRYCIVGQKSVIAQDPDKERRSGLGEGGGNDFFITLGGWTPEQQKDPRVFAGSFMHELGHTLNLAHETGNNPNYFSVMNHYWQVPGEGNEIAWQLDYSRGAPFVDWSNLRFYFLESPEFLAGVNSSALSTNTDEITSEKARSLGLIGTGNGVLRLDASLYETYDGAPDLIVTVHRTAESNATVTVDYATSNGTAFAGLDYLPVSGTLTFTGNESNKSFAIPILNNTSATASRAFNVGLSNPSGGATLGLRSNAIVRVVETRTNVVTTAADSGPGSLRQAILDANASEEHDVIFFNIPGSGAHSIRPLSPLPEITGSITIDGYTQPGATPNSLAQGNNAVLKIELDGSGVATSPAKDGLVISAGYSTVRGLVINRFIGQTNALVFAGSFGWQPTTDTLGSGIVLRDGSGSVIEGNFIGVDATGMNAANNCVGILITEGSSGNRIGGTTPAARNLILGFSASGIFVDQMATVVGSPGNVIQGNYIGTDRTGENVPPPGGLGSGGIFFGALPHQFEPGDAPGTLYFHGNYGLFGLQGSVRLYQATDTLIGGTAPGAGNLIVNEETTGLKALSLDESSGNTIQGNLLGLNSTGTQYLRYGGIRLSRSHENLIGGNAAAARNVVATGIQVEESERNTIQGNYIGTEMTGTVALPTSASVGLSLGGHGNWTLVLPVRSNAVVGNLIYGTTIGLQIQGQQNRIQGNLIGTDVTGIRSLPQINSLVGGVFIRQHSTTNDNNLIGGSNPGEGNVIAGHLGYGIRVFGSSGNHIRGNLIGVGGDGVTPLGNGGDGIVLNSSFPEVVGMDLWPALDGPTLQVVNNNWIGGTSAGDGNTIAYNGGRGVAVDNGLRNRVLGNSIHHNAGLGIELGNDGVTGNDAGDNDPGFVHVPDIYWGYTNWNPVIYTFAGTLVAQPNATYFLRFFVHNPDQTQPGQGFVMNAEFFTTDFSGVCNFFLEDVDLVPEPPTIRATQHVSVVATPVSVFLTGLPTIPGLGTTTVLGAFDAAPNTAYHLAFYSHQSRQPSPKGQQIMGTRRVLTDNFGHADFQFMFDQELPPGMLAGAYAIALPNRWQNFPVLNPVLRGAGSASITGSLDSASNTVYRVEFFADSAGDASGHGEGRRFLGATNLTTDAAGHANISLTLPTEVAPNEFVTATAIDPSGNTSEFSRATPDTVELAITQSASAALVAVGAPVTFSLTVTNRGTNLATSVVITNVLSSGAALLAITNSHGSVQTNGNLLTCAVGSLNPGSIATLSVTLAPLVPGPLTNSAAVAATQADWWSANNQATAVTAVGIADVQLIATELTSPAVVGQELTCVLMVTNTGPDLASGIVVSNLINQYLTLVATTNSQGSVIQSSNRVFWNAGSLAPGATASLVLVVSPLYVTLVDVLGVVSHERFDPVLANNQYYASVFPEPGPQLKFVGGAVSLREDAGSVSLQVQRIGNTNGTVMVDFATEAGTALPGTDFVSTNGTLVFSNGQTLQSLAVAILDNLQSGCNPGFTVNLANPARGATLGSVGTNYLVSIFDNEPILDSVVQPVSLADSNLPPVNGVTGNAASFDLAISADGRWVAFNSSATNLVAGDTNGQADIFLRDLQSTAITLMSVNRTGTGAASGNSFYPVISADGRYVAFKSDAPNLVVGDSDPAMDRIVRRDVVSGTTELVSVASSGSGPAHGFMANPIMSPDGRFIAFQSRANDLVPGDTHNYYHVYLRDMRHSTNRLVTAAGNGTNSANNTSGGPALSVDGRYVAFWSTANDFGPADTNGMSDVYIRDMQVGSNWLVSANLARTSGGNASSSWPVISANGRYLVYATEASNLVSDDGNGSSDVFVFDVLSRTNQLVSVNLAGTGSANGPSYSPAITADGHYIAFASEATNLVTNNVSGDWPNVFVRDQVTGKTRLVSVSCDGLSGANEYSDYPNFGGDGRYLAFEGYASNLAPGEYGGRWNIFRHDLNAGSTVLLSRRQSRDGDADADSYYALLNTNGNVAAFISGATDLVSDDLNGVEDIFLWRAEVSQVIAPTLMAVPTGSGQVTISWSPAIPGFALQETPSLSPTNWVNSPSGLTNPIVLPATPPAKFYRLRGP